MYFFTWILSVILLVISLSNKVSCDCAININGLNEDSPIILSTHIRQFIPLHNSPRGTVIVPQASFLTLLCPRSHRHTNFFRNYPRSNELLVQCADDGDTFLVKENNRTHPFDYLHCALPLEVSIFNTNVTCYGPRDSVDIKEDNRYTTKLLVGYQSNYEFLTVYEVCFDKGLTGPRYTLATISPDIDKRQPSAATAPWATDADLYRRVSLDAEYQCTAQSSTFYRILSKNYFNDYARCCFQKTKMVQIEDLVYPPQQLATFANVNTLPMCEQTNWNELQTQIRLLAVTLGRPLSVWTGVYKVLNDVSAETVIDRDVYIHYRNEMDKGIPVPHFVWKVVYDSHSEQAVAIVTLNDQKAARHGAEGLILCRDVCAELPWLNLPSRTEFKQGYTYCCHVDEFVKGFRYENIHPFPKHIVGLLQ